LLKQTDPIDIEAMKEADIPDKRENEGPVNFNADVIYTQHS